MRQLGFGNGGFCQRVDTVNNLFRIEAALAGKLLPVVLLRWSPRVLPAIFCARFFVMFSQTSPHIMSYIGASDALPARIMIE